MNQFDKMALATTTATTLFFAPSTFQMAQFYTGSGLVTDATLAIGITGWIIATFGPITIAAWFWRRSKQAQAPWILHHTLLPLAAITFHAGGSILLFALGQPDFDAMLGAPINPAILIFVIAIGSYALALISTKIRASRAQAQGQMK